MRLASIIILTLVILSSCATGKKGNWSEKDKKLAQREINKVRADLHSVLGDQTESFIKCYLYKVEQNYKNFQEADNDFKGCEKLAKQCMTEILK